MVAINGHNVTFVMYIKEKDKNTQLNNACLEVY